MADFDTIVIGAGLGGLTAAALLAEQGLRVCVLEKNTRLGGYAVNYTSHGHRYDVATQALGGCGEGGIVQSILAKLDLHVTFLACEPARLYHFPGSATPFIQHGFLEKQHDLLIELYPQHGESIQNCFKIFALIFTELQAIAACGTSPIFGFSKKFPTLAHYGRFTVQDFFEELHFPADLQVRVGARAGYCMLPLSELSLVAFACTEMSYGGGAWMVEGGVGKLVEMLATSVQKNNGAIRKRSRVKQLVFAGGEVVGVETMVGQTIKSDSVILAVDGVQILQQSGAPCLPLLSKYKEMDRTGSYLVSYYEVPAHSVENMQPNIEVRLAEQTLAGSTKIDVYYLLIPSLVDTTSAPDGTHSFCISVPLARGIAPDHEERQVIRQQLEQLVIGLYPKLAGNLRFLFELGPQHFESMTANTGGAAYGFCQTVGQSGIYRLGVKSQLKGLYLAGHWTMPGGGIAGVMTSGQLCARAVLGQASRAAEA